MTNEIGNDILHRVVDNLQKIELAEYSHKMNIKDAMDTADKNQEAKAEVLDDGSVRFSFTLGNSRP